MKLYYIDAEGMKLGRLMNVVKKTLQYTAKSYEASPQWLVLVSNCSKLAAPKNKMRTKKYYFHSGCPGGLRTLTWKEVRLTSSEKLIELAFRRMLSDTPRARSLIRKLRLNRNDFMNV